MRTAVRRLVTRFRHIAVRARDEGIAWTTAQTALRLLRFAFWLALLPLALALHLAGWRRLPVLASRIGHLASEPDCFLKLAALGRLPPRRWFIAAAPSDVANDHMLAYWRSRLRVIEQPALAAVLRAACRPPLAAQDIADYVLTQHGAARYGAVNAEWGARRALLEPTAEDREWGAAMLAQLGVPRDAWFACLHPRTPGFAAHDDRVHSYRNSDPARLVAAVGAIAQRGGWSVLMGDRSAPALPQVPNLVDYAHHPLRSERLDVVLCALCRFFLGSSSGLFAVSSAFGVPVALANMAPMSALPYRPGDLFIPKLYRDASGRLLPFAEVLAMPAAGFRHSRRFADMGITLLENSAEELVELVEDMLERIVAPRETRAAPADAFSALLRPHHYGYGSAARISPRFLTRHRQLLPRL